MSDIVKINGVESFAAAGLVVTMLPEISIPEEKMNREKIPGKSGYLHLSEDCYEEINKPVGFFYDGTNISAIVSYLMNAKTITFSNEPDYVYDCLFNGPAELSRAIENSLIFGNWHEFSVSFACNPEKRLITQVPVTISGVTSVTNPGNRAAYPSFGVTGTGTIVLTVGAQTVTLTDIDGTVIIDGNNLYCTDGTVRIDDKMSGKFPVIAAGATASVSVSGAVTDCKLTGNWRWV